MTDAEKVEYRRNAAIRKLDRMVTDIAYFLYDDAAKDKSRTGAKGIITFVENHREEQQLRIEFAKAQVLIQQVTEDYPEWTK